MRTSICLAFLGVGLSASVGLGEEPRPAITIRAVHPDRQALEVIGLFEGSRAAHPAAALAAWKRASREPGRLGKPLEALIASFNPRMADEIRTLDGAEVTLWFGPTDGRLAWGASIPNDDGTFAALASALVLSGGRTEPGPVDRLGGPGSPVMSRGPRGTILAGSPEGLRVVRDRAEDALDGLRVDPDGLSLIVDRGALDGSRSMAVRRLAEVLRSTSRSIAGQSDLQFGMATVILGLSVPDPIGRASIDPAWLDWIPSGGVVAGFSVAIPPGAETWDAAFGLADRVERVDPDRAGVAPIRLRLDLLARSVGVRTEADVLPHLRGVTGWAGSDGLAVDSGLVALHFADEASASRIADRIGPAPAPGATGSREIGRLDGKAVRLARVGRVLAIGWGEGALASSMSALDDPGRSSGQALRANWVKGIPSIAGGLWPARVPGLIPEPTPASEALRGASPVTFSGFWPDPTHFQVVALWDDLGTPVKRFLDLIPMDPPPDR